MSLQNLLVRLRITLDCWNIGNSPKWLNLTHSRRGIRPRFNCANLHNFLFIKVEFNWNKIIIISEEVTVLQFVNLKYLFFGEFYFTNVNLRTRGLNQEFNVCARGVKSRS